MKDADVCRSPCHGMVAICPKNEVPGNIDLDYYCRASHTGDACRGSGEGKREGDFI